MRKKKCNTEEEKPWFKHALSLFCSLSPIPKGSKYSGTRFNAITRLIIYITAILLLMKYRYWYVFLVGGIILLVCVYVKSYDVSQENFALLSDAIISNQNSMNGMNMLNPKPQYNFSQQVQQIRSDDPYNQLRLMPIDSENVTNTYTGYEEKALNVTKEPGHRDPQAGIQYYTPYVGVNPKTNVQPVIGPRLYDQDIWSKKSVVPNRINKLQIIDVTNEDTDKSDMAQLTNKYPYAQGYQYGYPLGLPVMYENRVPNGVWNMNPVGQDPDIGYYNKQEVLYNNTDYRDFNRNVLPIYQNPNSYVFPKIDMQSYGSTPTYTPWEKANTFPLPPTQYVGITQGMADAQMGSQCTSCVPPSTQAGVKEGFSFVDIDGGQATPVMNAAMNYNPQLGPYVSQAAPYPLQTQFNSDGNRGVFGAGPSYNIMNRVPPGQNAQIPAVTTQLMYQSPTLEYTDQYFNTPNNKLFLQTIQPQLYSYSVDQTPINSSVGISYAPQKPPMVLDQITDTAINKAYPLYSAVDPQLIRTDGTPGQKAMQPTRSDWSAEYSNFQAPAGSVNFEDIYDPRFTSYGSPYRSYSDVNLGQVQYYYSDVDAYKMPNFISRTNVDFVDFRTPMGQIWPEYIRNTGLDDVRSHVANQFDADALFYRQDIQSKQMDKINREKWQSRFAPINNNNSFRGSSAGAGI